MRTSRLIILFVLLLTTACTTVEPTRSFSSNITVVTTTPGQTATATVAPSPIPEPSATVTVTTPLDDFEAAETTWKAGLEPEYADSSALDLVLTGEHASESLQALQLNFEQNDKPKAIFYLDGPFDLSQAQSLQLDVFNPSSLTGVGIALTTGADNVWYESDSLPLAANKQTTLTFDLTSATFKAASTNWEFRAKISDPNSVSRLAIIIYPAKSGSAFIDNLRIITSQ
jgi:hypothetical protein